MELKPTNLLDATRLGLQRDKGKRKTDTLYIYGEGGEEEMVTL
jgi:hypothetical protein